jgi:amino acid adenylation domain-containing protein
MLELKQRISELTAEQREQLRQLLLGKPEMVAHSNPKRLGLTQGPLAMPQKRLWLLSRLDTGSTVYNLPGAFVLNGRLDGERLKQALLQVASRHEILRTQFLVNAQGEPWQQVMDEVHLDVKILAPKPPPTGFDLEQLDALAREVAQLPLDIAQGQSWRAALIRLEPERHLLALSFHHIVFDAWSLGLFARELFDIYQALMQGTKPAPDAKALQYLDYTAWRESSYDAAARDRDRAFWQANLASQPGPLELPADRARPAQQTFAGALHKRVLPRSVLERVRQLASSEACTPFSVLLAVYQTLLYRYSGQNDVTVGVPVSGRDNAAIEPLIGMFVNILPIRVQLRSQDSLRAILRNVRDATLGAFEHGVLPFHEIVSAVDPQRSNAHHPLFQTLFAYQNSIVPISLPGLGVAYLDVDVGSAKFDLSLDVFESMEGLSCLFEFNTDLFDHDRIARLAVYFEVLLGAALDAPDSPISALRLLPDDELQRIQAGPERAKLAAPSGNFVSLFEAHAARTPKAPALRSQGTTLSYGELNARANRLARQLRTSGATAEQPIGICLERGPLLFEAVLAVLKLGAAFVALDPTHPARRLAFVAGDAGVQWVVSETAHRVALQALSVPVLWADATAPERTALPEGNLGTAISGSQAAYVVYTSGTTGQPKGVQVTHANVMNAYLGWSQVFQLDNLHAHLQMASFSFDVFCGDLIRALGSGKTLVICPHEMFAAPESLLRLIEDEGVDCAEFVPAVFRGLAEHLLEQRQKLAKMQVLIVASDSWYVSEYRRYRDLLGPSGRLINSYGMAEATIDSTWFEAEVDGMEDGALVPIGQPFPNVEVMVLDSQLQPLPIGVPGEICVGGAGVAAGYLNRPELNAEKFVPHPFSRAVGARLYRTGDLGRLREDGQLELLGRRDTQVKVRGMRIELGEIEMALRQHAPGVTDSAAKVCTIQDGSVHGNSQIVAYVVAQADAKPSPDELNAVLTQYVPSYMLPSRYVFLDALPLSANGKLDRQRLPEPDAGPGDDKRGFVTPRTLIEEILATVWCQVFHLNRVSVFDNFFALGGHSLLAFQLVSRARDAFQVELPLRTLFVNPTIASLAEFISDLQGRRAEYDATVNALPTIVPDHANQDLPFPMTEVQQAYWLGRNEVFEFGNVTTHSYDELETSHIDLARFQRAWNQVVARHPMLRAEILPEGTQRILPQVPEYVIRELDLRGLPDDAVQAGIEDVRTEMSHQMLDVYRWPVFDVRVTRLSDDKTRLHFSTDALMFDVWSFIIIIEELVKFYLDEAVALPPLELSFRDYVLAEQSLHGSERYRRALAYWRNRIPTLAPPPDLPMAMDPSMLKKPHFTRLHAELDPESWGRLKLKAVRAGITTTGLMLAAYAEVLAAYSRDPAFSLNITFLNRQPIHPQVHEIVGEFTSLTMLGVDQTRANTFAERARLIQGDLWNDLEHHNVSGIQILRELTREQGGATRAKMPVVFTSAFVVPIPKRKESFPAVPVYRDGITQTSQVWLDCGVWEDNHVLLCNWDVALEIYPKGLMEEMFDAYWRLVRRLANDDAAWHSTESPMAPARPPTPTTDMLPTLPLSDETLDSLFLRSMGKTPCAPAIIAGDRHLSYEDLGEHAAWVAQAIADHSTKGELVAVLMDKGWEQVAAVLGIVTTGAAYLPIDPALPDERIAAILTDGKVRCVVTTPNWRERFALASGPASKYAWVVLDASCQAPVSGLYALDGPSPGDIAYVIFTSGSTGRPKGVTIDHRGAVNTVLDVNDRYAVDAQDRVLAVSSLSFDLSVYDIFGLLAAGGTIVIPEHSRRLDPTHWLQLVRQHGVTLWNSVPALCGLLVDHCEQADTTLPSLRRILLSGDWIAVTLPGRLRASCPHAAVTSMGGATEASVWSVLYDIDEVDPQWRSIPYGKAMRNQTIDVLNSNLDPCPDWVVGPIYIGGTGVALGYWCDEVKTLASFVRHPRSGERLYRTGDLGRRLPDGNIEFLGRNDSQVKVQGHRIELGEIETVLAQHPMVRETVAVARGAQRGENRLAAFVVLAEGQTFDAAALRQWLLEHLPEYMVPRDLNPIAQLPLTANGKVNRNALPTPLEINAPQRPEPVAPRNPVEQQIEGIWREVLEQEQVGVHDDFFTIGGDSMLAIKLLTALRHRLRANYQLRDIFLHSTVAAQAQHLSTLEDTPT